MVTGKNGSSTWELLSLKNCYGLLTFPTAKRKLDHFFYMRLEHLHSCLRLYLPRFPSLFTRHLWWFIVRGLQNPLSGLSNINGEAYIWLTHGMHLTTSKILVRKFFRIAAIFYTIILPNAVFVPGQVLPSTPSRINIYSNSTVAYLAGILSNRDQVEHEF